MRFFGLGLLAVLLSACVRSGPPSVYTNWQGSRIALRTAYERYSLPNGLEVVLSPDARLPIVAVRLVYRVGSQDDPPHLEGFAHLFEHLMFQGSRHVAEDMFFKHLERVGAPYIQGQTRTESTVYSETVPSSQLALALWLESDRMAFLLDHVNADTFETQRRVVENELREKLDNTPYGRVGTFIEGRLFPPGHPYHGRSVTTDGLRRASLTDVRAFWQAHYRPNNATLFVSGDLRVPEARQQIERYFGPIVPGQLAPLPSVTAAPDPAPGSRLDVEAAVPLGMVIMTWLTPPFGAQEDAELDVIGDILEQGQLTWNLLEAEELATRVRAGQQSQKLTSVFQIAVTTRPGVEAERVVRVVDKALDGIRRRWQEPSFIRSMSFRTLVELALVHEEPTQRVAQMADDAVMTGDPNYIEKNVARYEAITAESLMRTAQKFLSPEKRLLTVVTPVQRAPVAGRVVRSK
jgi:predicted Zn-dependent peptidase